jgi:hypothetical protein
VLLGSVHLSYQHQRYDHSKLVQFVSATCDCCWPLQQHYYYMFGLAVASTWLPQMFWVQVCWYACVQVSW